jgi:hypothetical protein
MARRKGFSFAELSFMPVDFILKNLAFLVFLGFLAVIYIANSHYAERNVREIQELQKDLKELRWFYMSLQSENMVNSMQSEVMDKIADDGLKLQRGKVKKIVVSK